MVKLYDASILTGPANINEAEIRPEGAKTGTHHLSDTIEPPELRPATAGLLSRGDIVEMGGVEYRISQITYFLSYNEFKEGLSGNGENLALDLVGVDEGTTPRRLWVPLDNSVRDYNGVGGKTITLVQAFSPDVMNQLPWSYVQADDDFRIDVTCFATGTLIETDKGPRPVQLLRVGDMVRTRDHGMQPLRWLGGRRLSAADVAANPKLNPIRIAAGALGAGMPARDLCVSPQHRMLVRSPIAERMTGSTEVLVAAVHLVGHPGVERVEAPGGIGYWHLMFDRHEIVFAEEAEAESLYLGPMALEAITEDGLEELRTLFPDLVGPRRSDPPPPARPVMRGKPVRKLIERQVKNLKPLVAVLA